MDISNRIELNSVTLKKRNFRGEVMDYNERGNRTVLIVLGIKQAHDLGFDTVTDMYNTLKAEQWAIKRFNATEDNDDPDCFMPATAVYFDNEKSMIFEKVGRGGRSNLLTQDSVGSLDRAEIENVDVILQKHYYNSHGREGYNNRIKSMEVTILEDAICARNRRNDYDDEEQIPFN